MLVPYFATTSCYFMNEGEFVGEVQTNFLLGYPSRNNGRNDVLLSAAALNNTSFRRFFPFLEAG